MLILFDKIIIIAYKLETVFFYFFYNALLYEESSTLPEE